MRLSPRLVALTGAGLLCVAGVVAASTAVALPSSTNTVNSKAVSFTPATIVDPLLYGGEPGVDVDPTDPTGNRVFVDWPVSSRAMIGVLFRSQDGGLSYTKRYADTTSAAEGGPACAGRQTPFCFSGGGGDTTVNINPTTGTVYMSNQELLANQAVGASLDHGTTFPSDHVDPVVAQSSAVDRQWLASLKGTDTAYLAYHVPAAGIYVNRTDKAGALGSWSASPVPKVTGVSQTGGMVIDNSDGPHKGTLYIGYLAFFPTSDMNVAVSTDGGATFQTHKVPGGDNARNFTVVGIDKAGNLYATYVDRATNQTYLTTSKVSAAANNLSPGSVWSTPVLVSNAPLKITIFSNIVAGDAGRIAVGYYGSTVNAGTPDAVKPGQGGWSPYVAVSTDALCQWDANPCRNGPAFTQSRISDHINQDDNICTSGTACAATMGNRNLADYFALHLDPKGHLIAVWSDAYNKQTDGTLVGWPTVVTARQASGPSLYAGQPVAKRSRRANGEVAAAGNALYPLAGGQALKATNHPTLDLLGTTIGLANPTTLQVRMRLAQTTGLSGGVPAVGTQDGLTTIEAARYLTRFDVDGHVYYLGADVKGGAGNAPVFYAGEVSSAEALKNPASPTTPIGNTYAHLLPAAGRIEGGALVVEVPLASLAGMRAGSQLDTVSSFSMLGELTTTPTSVLLTHLPYTIDATPSFDTTLAALPRRASAVQAGSAVVRAQAATAASPLTLASTGLPVGLGALGLLLLGAALVTSRRQAA